MEAFFLAVNIFCNMMFIRLALIALWKERAMIESVRRRPETLASSICCHPTVLRTLFEAKVWSYRGYCGFVADALEEILKEDEPGE